MGTPDDPFLFEHCAGALKKMLRLMEIELRWNVRARRMECRNRGKEWKSLDDRRKMAIWRCIEKNFYCFDWRYVHRNRVLPCRYGRNSWSSAIRQLREEVEFDPLGEAVESWWNDRVEIVGRNFDTPCRDLLSDFMQHSGEKVHHKAFQSWLIRERDRDVILGVRRIDGRRTVIVRGARLRQVDGC